MSSVVWVVPKAPLPAFDGARVAVCALLKELARQGLNIHLIIVNTEGQSDDTIAIQTELGVASVQYVDPARFLSLRLKPRVHSAALALLRPCVGVTLQRYVIPRLRTLVRSTIQQYECQTVVFDGLHPAAAFTGWSGSFGGLEGVAVVYRAHNRESQIWNRKADRAQGLFRLFLRFQAAVVRRFENSLVAAAHCTCTVSSDDREQFRQALPNARYEVVPIGYDFSREQTPIQSTNNVFFIGRLDWPPNREGLQWFLERVWPQVITEKPEMTLAIVGSGDGEWIQPLKNMQGVFFHGRVASIEPFYDAASVCVIPVFFGSGTRVKAIEAARFGRPCLSTAVGVEGLPMAPGEQYIHAETDREWIAALTSLSQESLESVAKAAHQNLAYTFDKKNCAEKMRACVTIST